MQSIATYLLPVLLLLAPTVSTPTASPFMGTITSPVAGTAIAPGGQFPFAYQTDNWCHQGYTSFNVLLVPGPDVPTFSDLTDTGGVEQAVFDFGTFLIPNFGLPPMGTPPPQTLTMPDLFELLNTTLSDAIFFVTVVDEFESCPGHIAEELGVTSTQIIYNATSST